MCLSFLEHLVSSTDNQIKLCTLATIWPWSEFWSEFGLSSVWILVWIWSEFWSEVGLDLVWILVWICWLDFYKKKPIFIGFGEVWMVWIWSEFWSEFGLSFGLNLGWIWSGFIFSEFGLNFSDLGLWTQGCILSRPILVLTSVSVLVAWTFCFFCFSLVGGGVSM